MPSLFLQFSPVLFQGSPFRFHRRKKSDSNSLVAQQPVSRAQPLHQWPCTSRPAKPKTSASRPPGTLERAAGRRHPTVGRAPPARFPSPCPAAARRLPTGGGAGRAHARDAAGRAGHTPPTHSESLSLPALAPSPSGVSHSLPVAAGESLLPPSYSLRGGSSGSSGRGRPRKRETDLIKFPETTTTKKGPRWGGTPILPRPSPKA